MTGCKLDVREVLTDLLGNASLILRSSLCWFADGSHFWLRTSHTPRTSLSGGKGCQIDVWSVHDGTAHSIGNGPHYVTSVALRGFNFFHLGPDEKSYVWVHFRLYITMGGCEANKMPWCSWNKATQLLAIVLYVSIHLSIHPSIYIGGTLLEVTPKLD